MKQVEAAVIWIGWAAFAPRCCRAPRWSTNYTYTAADLSAERGEPVDLPLSNEALSAAAELSARQRA